MKCGDPESERIQKQEKELQHLEIPGDANIASARLLDEYPASQLAAFSRQMKSGKNNLDKIDYVGYRDY